MHHLDKRLRSIKLLFLIINIKLPLLQRSMRTGEFGLFIELHYLAIFGRKTRMGVRLGIVTTVRSNPIAPPTANT